MPFSPNQTTTQPQVASDSAATAPPKVPGSDKNYQARIDELYGRAKHFERENGDLRERLARLEGRADIQPEERPRQNPRAPKNWEEMEDGQLDEAWNYASADDTRNPAVLNQVFEEKLRRGVTKAVKQATEQSQRHMEQSQLLERVNAEILRDFGAEAFEEGSPLFEAAYVEMQRYVAVLGKDAVMKDPTKRYDAFLRAFNKTKTPAERERLQALEKENVALHQRASVLERNGVIGAAPRPSDEVRELLKAGDKKGAIKKLRLVQSLVQDVNRRMVLPERT